MTDIDGPRNRSTRRSFLTAGGLTLVGATVGGIPRYRGDPPTTLGADAERGHDDSSNQTVVARQQEGKTVYWVKPGARRLSPHVFGTPDSPRFGSDLLGGRIEQAKELPEPLGNAIPQLLEDLPSLVAAPEGARKPLHDEDTVAREVFAEPTLFSDEAQVTSGQFEATYEDRRPYDARGPPGETSDLVDLDATFTDPAGHTYELNLDHVVQPPIPGYETGGGVMVDAWHHGQTATGSPLMPQLYAFAAFWGVGDVIVDGTVATEDGFRVIHFMTTQTVRDKRYRLAIDEELPLAPENTIAGQAHHTHGVVLPIKPTDEGPVFEPVPTAFELPNGETQPFIHAMWEQDEIVEGPFTDRSTTDETDPDGKRDGGSDADFRLGGNASAWQGQAPEAIEGTGNPTLTLQARTRYTLLWENLDGIQHNFAIEDENGEDVLATDLVGEQGATQTVTFTASNGMTEYYCQVHPNTMRGAIEIQG